LNELAAVRVFQDGLTCASHNEDVPRFVRTQAVGACHSQTSNDLAAWIRKDVHVAARRHVKKVAGPRAFPGCGIECAVMPLVAPYGIAPGAPTGGCDPPHPASIAAAAQVSTQRLRLEFFIYLLPLDQIGLLR